MARRLTAQERRIAALLAKLRPIVQKAFLDATRAQARAVDMNSLIRALEAGNIERAINLLRVNQAVLFPLTEATRATYIAGGTAVGEALPIVLRAQFGFGGNPRAVAAVERISGKLVQNLENQSLKMLRTVITSGVKEGIPPARLALDIAGRIAPGTRTRSGGFIGLDNERAKQAMRVEKILGDPDLIGEYFKGKNPRYTTTDRRFDARVRKAISEGKALSKSDIKKITHLHRSRLLKSRATAIARNETLNALRAGQHDGFGTLIDDGVVDADRMTKKWLSASDDRVRPSHATLNGTVIGFDELFVSPATGAQMAYSGDTSHGAEQEDTSLCRCGTVYRIKPKRR